MNAKRSFVASLAVLALGVAGLIGGGAATGHAAGTAATPFELTVEAISPDYITAEGTFRSRAPFCAGGRAFEFPEDRFAIWRFTCDDGTGSMTVAVRQDSTWWIKDGRDSYARLRGKGSLRGDCDKDCELDRGRWRGTFVGVVYPDAVAPTVSFSSATAKKLRRPAGAYALRISIALRDNVTDNPVSYAVRACSYTVDACAGRLELACAFGTATGAVLTTLRIRPPAGLRTVQLQLTAEDSVGNAVSVRRALGLPR